MMRPTLVDRIPPPGWGGAGVLGARVFVAARQEDEDLRQLVSGPSSSSMAGAASPSPGVEPSRGSGHQAHTRLWADEACSRTAGGAVISPVRPEPSLPFYPGLETGRPEHANYGFGRDDDLDRLAGARSQPSFQTLHLKGGSGAGRSRSSSPDGE